MIPSAQLIAFRHELQKTGAHPYVHGATALGGAALAARGVAPHMFREHERDLRDYHLGEMDDDVLRLRNRRRLKQTAAAVGTGALLGGLTPYAAEALGREVMERLKGRRAAAEEAVRGAGRAAAEGVKDTARGAGRAAAQGAADAFSERADDMAGAAKRTARSAFEGMADAAEERAKAHAPHVKDYVGDVAEEAARRGKKGIFTRRTSEGTEVAGTSLFNRLFR